MKKIEVYNPVNLVTSSSITATLLGKADLSVGDEVRIYDSEGQECCYADIETVWHGALCDIPAIFLEMAHDPLQRTFSGVHMHLTASAGHAIGITDKVTVVGFKTKMNTVIRPNQRIVT